MEKLVLVFIGLILGVAALGFLIFSLVKLIKDRSVKELNKKVLIKLLISGIGLGGSVVLTTFGAKIALNWEMKPLYIVLVVVFGLLLGVSFVAFIANFVLRYYKTNLTNEKQAKWVTRVMFISIPVLVGTFFLFMEGVAPYLTYPLYNTIRIGSDKGFLALTRFNETANGGLSIAFYGILIVSGAVLVYFLCDHKLYKIYHKHGLIDTCFIIAFPSGIVGARLWFCLVLKTDYYLAHPAEIIRMWDGGLAIMGGAILGIIAGVTYLLLCRRYINIRQAMDLIVPTILIAQAIGRIGNFFNHEVYGNIVNESDWLFIPTFIRNQMAVYEGGIRQEGLMYVPLFFIEAITNLTGYFVIRFAIGKTLYKFRNFPLGTLSGCYLIWYGLTRVIMEPLRYGESGEVDKFQNSFISAFILVGLGVLLILGFMGYEHYMRYISPKHKTYELEKQQQYIRHEDVKLLEE